MSDAFESLQFRRCIAKYYLKIPELGPGLCYGLSLTVIDSPKQAEMTNNADFIPGKAPSLLPTGNQGSSSQSVSILRDLDPRSAKLGTSPSFPYRTILLGAVPLAIGVGLLSGYFYSAATDEGSGASAASAADLPFAAVPREVSVSPSTVAAVSSENTSNAPQESQKPAIILAHPDIRESGTDQPKENPLGIQAEDYTGQPPASRSIIQGKATGKSESTTTGKQINQKAAHKTAQVAHVKSPGISKSKSQVREKMAIEHEIDIITAIVKGSQN